MHARKTIVLAAGLALALGAGRTSGQSIANPPAPASPPSQNPQTAESTPRPLRVTTRLVQVSVIVHDKHGNPITGLTKDDFVILDEKKQQAIQVFSVQTNQVLTSPAQELPPDTYTNRLEARGGAPPNVTVVLLDALNTSFMDKAFVRRRLVKYLQTIQPQDRVALYALGTRLRILHDFTSDASSLLASLQKFKDDIAPEIDESHLDPMGLASKKLGKVSAESDAVSSATGAVELTVEALREIAEHVAELPGRKNLIWVSGAFPFSIGTNNFRMGYYGEKVTFSTQIELAARALSNANVAIYPVDARGLVATDVDGPGGNPFKAPDTDDIATMQILAERTGGRAYFNTNDIMGSIRDAVNDSRVTYELAFSPNDIKWDGSFHTIRVKVNRPDAVVQVRKGYFALAEPNVTPQQHLMIMAETAKSPMEASGIQMNVQATTGMAVQGKTLKLTLSFATQQFSFEQLNGQWNAMVDTAFVQLDDSNEIIASSVRPFPLHLDAATYERLLKQGLTYTAEMLIVPSAVQVRVILRDHSNGKIGSVSIPLAQYFPENTK
jgi:VWFA-related protein